MTSTPYSVPSTRYSVPGTGYSVREHLPAGVGIALWLGLAIHTVCSTCVTHDEFWHLPAGLRAWSGDFAVDRLNPPLSRLWAALPVRLCSVTANPGADASC